VTETHYALDEATRASQTFYYLALPEPGEDNFYRATMSCNAFFNSARSPKANVTEFRQFTLHDPTDTMHRKEYLRHVAWDDLRCFPSIWDFFTFIGYDHRTRSYASGERLKTWTGTGFIVKQRRRKK